MTRPVLASNYLAASHNGVLLEDYSVIGDFVSEGGTGTQTLAADTTNVRVGTASMKLSQSGASGGNTGARKYYNPALNLGSADVFSLWVYAAHANTEPARTATYATTFNVYVSSDAAAGTYSNYKLATLGGTNTGIIQKGWNLWQFRKSTFGGGAGTLDWSSVRNIRIVMTAANAGPDNVAECTIDSLYIGYRSRPKVILTLDDSEISQYDRVIEANTYGIPVTLHVIPSLIASGGGDTYLTAAQCVTLDAARNLIATHGKFVWIDGDYGAAEVAECRSFIATNSLNPAGGYHAAYPEGKFNTALQAALAADGVLTARSIQGITYDAGPPERLQSIGSSSVQTTSRGPANLFALNARPLGPTVTPADVLTDVDLAVSLGCSIFIYGHSFVEADASGLNWLNSSWTTLMQGLALRSSQGLLDCVTTAQWYDGLAGVRSDAGVRAA